MIGRVLGHHRVLERIGAGGMGEVYRALDENLERDVALKILRAGALADPAARRRFRKEALALSKLNHPNIETVHEFAVQDGLDFLVMEYVEGVTLSDTLEAGPLAEKELCRLGEQLAEGLAAAHARGVVHLDLKPANLRVTPDGRLKILDFGLARLLAGERPVGADATETLTEIHGVAGTLAYMAPEQLRGERVDHRADLWAAGVVLYEGATGRRPFEGKLVTAIAAEIQSRPPIPPSRIRPGLSPDLERIILKCLEKDPDLRYRSALDLSADLRRLEAAARPGEIDTNVARGGARWRPSRAAALRAMLVLLVGSAIFVGAAVEWRRRAERAGTSATPIKSLAVLPLEDLSDRPGEDHVVEALHETLITELSQIAALRVISRTSTIRFKPGDRSLSRIAEELGVDAVLEGSVLRVGGRVRVSVQLVRIDPERHLWAENFDREFTDVLYLTGDVAQAVAREIRVTLTPTERASLSRARPVDPEAYELYAVGRHLWNQRTLDGYRRAIESFRRALDRDPGDALVHSGLADAYMLLGEQGGLPQEEARTLAEAAIRKALDSDPELPAAHVSMGQWQFYYAWNWAEAEREFLRAIELNPGDAAAHQFYGRTLAFVGRHEDAFRELQRARELDPLSIVVHAYIGQALLFARRYDEASEHLRWALELSPNHPLLLHNLGEVHLAEGRFAEAVIELEKSVAVSGDPSVHYSAMLGCAYARAKKRARALEVLKELSRQSERGLASDFDMASLHAALGNPGSAMDALEGGYRRRDVWLAELNAWPWFESLASDPRFEGLLERVNLFTQGGVERKRAKP